MAQAICGWCGVPTYLEGVKTISDAEIHGNSGHWNEGAFVCANCRHMSVARWWTDTDEWGVVSSTEPGRDATWHPVPSEHQDFPDVPEAVALAAAEAYQCFSIHAYRASAALARAVIEASANTRGATEKDLYKKIDGLCERGLIRPDMKEAAHEIRHLGNAAAHGDLVNPISQTDCDEILVLMSELLNELFQSPARVERRRQARIEKKTAATQQTNEQDRGA